MESVAKNSIPLQDAFVPNPYPLSSCLDMTLRAEIEFVLKEEGVDLHVANAPGNPPFRSLCGRWHLSVAVKWLQVDLEISLSKFRLDCNGG